MFHSEYCEIVKNSAFYRITMVAACDPNKVPLCHFGTGK